MQRDALIVPAYLISMFVVYETIAINIICANLLGLWTLVDLSVLAASICSVSLLIFLTQTMRSSWNHLNLISHTLKKVRNSAQVIGVYKRFQMNAHRIIELSLSKHTAVLVMHT